MKRHVGGVAEYRAAEGKTVKLPLRDPIENTARDIFGLTCVQLVRPRWGFTPERADQSAPRLFDDAGNKENRIFNNLYDLPTLAVGATRQRYPIHRVLTNGKFGGPNTTSVPIIPSVMIQQHLVPVGLRGLSASAIVFSVMMGEGCLT